MTTFITWHKSINADFIEFYPTVSEGGETIQELPLENEAGTHFVVGTVCLSASGQAVLAAEFGEDISFEEQE